MKFTLNIIEEDGATLTSTFTAYSKDKILSRVEDFLRGAGFVLDGVILDVKEENEVDYEYSRTDSEILRSTEECLGDHDDSIGESTAIAHHRAP